MPSTSPPYFVTEPTSPATFRASAPLGAGRVQMLGGNIGLMQKANARRPLCTHVGVDGFTVNTMAPNTNPYNLNPDYPFIPPYSAQINWNLAACDTKDTTGSAICFGDILIPSTFPGRDPIMPNIVLRFMGKVTSGGTVYCWFGITPQDVDINAGSAGGSPAYTCLGGTGFPPPITATTFTAYEMVVSLGAIGGILADTISTITATSAGSTAPPSTPELGPLSRCTLWFGAFCSTGATGSCVGMSVYLEDPG